MSITKCIFKYGFFFGIASILLSFVFYINEIFISENMAHSIILFSLTIIVIVFTLIIYKKNNNNHITLKQSMIIGTGIALVGGLISEAWRVLLFEVIDPDLIIQLQEKQFKITLKQNSNLSQNDINNNIDLIKTVSSIKITVLRLIEDLFTGLIISFLGGTIISKKRDPFK